MYPDPYGLESTGRILPTADEIRDREERIEKGTNGMIVAGLIIAVIGVLIYFCG